jgi:hypothetical protein
MSEYIYERKIPKNMLKTGGNRAKDGFWRSLNAKTAGEFLCAKKSVTQL